MYERPRHIIDAVADPTTDDDNEHGFEVGSQWINIITKTLFICIDATENAAIWRSITAAVSANSFNDLVFTTNGQIIYSAQNRGEIITI